MLCQVFFPYLTEFVESFFIFPVHVWEGKEPVELTIGETMIKIPDKLKSKAKTQAQFCDEICPGLHTRAEKSKPESQLVCLGST